MSEIEVMGLEMSESGDNALYLDYCEVVGNKPAYAVCLNKMKSKSIAHIGCYSAGKRCSCEAAIKRKEEIEKGHAIYFIKREKSIEPLKMPLVVHSFKKNPVTHSMEKSLPNTSSDAPESASYNSSADEGFDDGDYASVINQEIKRASESGHI